MCMQATLTQLQPVLIVYNATYAWRKFIYEETQTAKEKNCETFSENSKGTPEAEVCTYDASRQAVQAALAG